MPDLKQHALCGLYGPLAFGLVCKVRTHLIGLLEVQIASCFLHSADSDDRKDDSCFPIFNGSINDRVECFEMFKLRYSSVIPTSFGPDFCADVKE